MSLGRFDRVEPVLDKLLAPAMKANLEAEVLGWANRTRVRVLLSTGRLAGVDRALALVEQNLKANPSSPEDQRLKAMILARRTSRRRDAIGLLEPLDQANQLDAADQFILAQIYLAEREVDKYRGQMLKILAAGDRNPQHLVHFIDFLIGRQELDQAEQWLAELKQVEPGSLGLFVREARLLKARNRDSELLERLQA